MIDLIGLIDGWFQSTMHFRMTNSQMEAVEIHKAPEIGRWAIENKQSKKISPTEHRCVSGWVVGRITMCVWWMYGWMDRWIIGLVD